MVGDDAAVEVSRLLLRVNLSGGSGYCCDNVRRMDEYRDVGKAGPNDMLFVGWFFILITRSQTSHSIYEVFLHCQLKYAVKFFRILICAAGAGRKLPVQGIWPKIFFYSELLKVTNENS